MFVFNLFVFCGVFLSWMHGHSDSLYDDRMMRHAGRLGRGIVFMRVIMIGSL